MIKYKIIFKKRKSISILLDKDGNIIVNAPKNISKKYIDNFVQSNKKWIENNKKVIQQRSKNKTTLLYLGEETKLLISNEDFENIKFNGINFYISRKNKDNSKELLHKFYIDQANKIIKKRIIFYTKKYNFRINKIKISNANTRWGSCGARNNININWKLIMADKKIIDYVIIHELAHTIEHNHSKNFWGIIENIMPDYKERKDWLRKNGNLLYI
ncbi:MAG TPA: SprT family zinc-dependent metalloprotease [bacterium]|nr:SprT family zinc-dependent metalloprotease [bacterium]